MIGKQKQFPLCYQSYKNTVNKALIIYGKNILEEHNFHPMIMVALILIKARIL
jgi:hypothetical protein